MGVTRCAWCRGSAQLIAYHDTEWGVPLHDDRKLFEFMVLDAFQAGLSWATILHKRESFARAFDGFDPRRIARYGAREVDALLGDAGIVRNRQKIAATIHNAGLFLEVQREHGSFDAYIWRLAGGRTRQNAYRVERRIPPRTRQSDAMSAELKRRGFKFVGSTICYAFMQAAGMVNDHIVSCFRHAEVARLGRGPGC